MNKEEQLKNAIKELHEKIATLMEIQWGENYLEPFDDKELINTVNLMSEEIENIT